MAIEVFFCSESDFHRIFTIMSDAFAGDQPGWDILYPKYHTPLGRIQGAERMLHMKRTDATNRFLKATDTATGEIIGQAKWIVFGDGMPEEVPLAGDYWESGDEKEKEYAKFVHEGLAEPRRRVARSVEGPLVGSLSRTRSADGLQWIYTALDILTVDPKHQRRRAGRMLVEWGVKMADEMGAEMCVEASVFGKHLYEQNGFRVTENVVVQVPEKWRGMPKIEFMFMRRPMNSPASKIDSGDNSRTS